MQVLIDTDAFCKLAVGGLLDDSVRLLGADLSRCGRLPALPYMLKRGRLRDRYGTSVCEELIPLANTMPVVSSTNDIYLNQLAGMSEVDPGEAQLLAKAAEAKLHLITGDKRSLRSLKNISLITEDVAGRIIVLESLLLALCNSLGTEEIRRGVEELTNFDKMMSICFSELNEEPVDCLRSYLLALAEEVKPLLLWQPTGYWL